MNTKQGTEAGTIPKKKQKTGGNMETLSMIGCNGNLSTENTNITYLNVYMYVLHI